MQSSAQKNFAAGIDACDRQHEAAQFRPEMAVDAVRQRRHDAAAVGRQPTLAPEPDRRRLDDQVLDDEVLVALEAGARRNLGLHDPILDRHSRQVRLAAATSLAAGVRCRISRARLLHAARPVGLDVRPALQTLQPRDLLALLANRLLQRRHLAKQFQHQLPELGVRQIIERVRRRLRHRSIESENHRFGNPLPPD
ncbi:hypothetical protein SF83666_a43120 (plasmid) [Sinorhizobium fredii CCBAU 83666]|nr:hypothetical protein SF83666_a43120 [Sinorhizobium fredii CCBAU 83666]